MYAIIQAAGHQYRVEPGQVLDIDRIGSEAGETVTFDQVLLLGRDDGTVAAGNPTVPGATVTGFVDAQARGPKIRVFKHKRRKGMRRTRGHRTDLTRVRISDISDSVGDISDSDD